LQSSFHIKLMIPIPELVRGHTATK